MDTLYTFVLLFALCFTVTWASAVGQTMQFEDITASAGIPAGIRGHGAAVADFDDDGWDDILLVASNGSSRLLRNVSDASFADVTESAGIEVSGNYSVGLFGDLNGDGLTDLFFGQRSGASNKIYLSRGDGTFEDATESSGVDSLASVASAAFGDYDRDGAVDLFLATRAGPDLLYRNRAHEQGASLFLDVTDAAGIAGSALSVAMQSTWIDYDEDGDLDLFCVHDGRTESRLYQNSGGLPFADVAAAARIDTYPSQSVCCNMGVAWGDVNGDGWLDAYVTRIGHGGLYRNNGDGTFDDVADEVGADHNGMSWGVVFEDFDNDADLDLFIVSTEGFDGTPTMLYRNDNGVFSEIGLQAAAQFPSQGPGLASGDFDNDGLVDLLVMSNDGANLLLRNKTTGAGNWVEVTLVSQSSNTRAIGARLEVIANGRLHVRTVTGGNSYASQSSLRMHVGLGDATRIDTLRVYWPGGEVDEVVDLAADQTYTLTQGLSTADEQPPELPTGEPAMYNYPNPFVGATEIRYVVAAPGHVWLDVYDLLGRRVVRLVDEFKTAGSHTVTFDGRDLPPSTYFYQLTSNGQASARTMLLVR